MSGATATLREYPMGWVLALYRNGDDLYLRGRRLRRFRHRHLALQFAARRGITIEGSTE